MILIEKTVTILCSLEVWNQKMNPPLISSILTLNLQELDYIYIYVHIVPIGYIYVVILLHKKDNWANKSCMYAYFNLHIAMQKFAFGSL